jgi:DNA-binding response OmpR family regulator
LTAILIIDDDVALLAGLAAQLEDAAFTVAKSSDVDHAEALFAEERPDLVIIEPHIGGGAGWAALGRMALQAPVIVLSRAGREEDVVRGFAAGAIDYVSKPYRSAELLARVRVRLQAAASPALMTAADPLPSPPRATPPPAIKPPPRRDEPEQSAVFMSEAEEMALLRTPPPRSEAVASAASDESQGLGARLRAERLRRQFTLVQVENELKIRMSYLQALEDEKFTLLPRGPVALQMVRTYAEHLGMPADAVLAEFRQHFSIEPVAPPPALGGARLPRSIPRWLIWLAAILLALAVAVGAILAFDPNFFLTLPERIEPLLPDWATVTSFIAPTE